MKIFENTEAFIELEREVELPFSEVEKTFQEYHNKNIYKKLNTIFYYYENGFYYFDYQTNPLNNKQNKTWYFIEAKVDSKTGRLFPMNEPIDWRKL
ncbi:hypothetical protein [Empedobacter tilapiae]